MIIVDGYLDLANSALLYGRNLFQPLPVRTKKSGPDEDGFEEEGLGESDPYKPKSKRGASMVTIPGLQEAGVALVFGAIFCPPDRGRVSSGSGGRFGYRTSEEAHIDGQRKLDFYHRLVDEVEIARIVGDETVLQEVVESHNKEADSLIGIIPIMMGADPIREPGEAEMWYERGVRIISLAWDDTRYAAGAWRGQGGLTDEGRHLLEIMASLGFILDLSNLSEGASFEALDIFEGSLIASHSNARALVDRPGLLSDEQIRRLVERDGMVGITLANPLLKAGHRRGEPRTAVTLADVVAHIDYICQFAGDSRHVGIGSDLDGTYGREDVPAELSDVSDLHLIGNALQGYGYSEYDVARIMGGNWINLLQQALPETS